MVVRGNKGVNKIKRSAGGFLQCEPDEVESRIPDPWCVPATVLVMRQTASHSFGSVSSRNASTSSLSCSNGVAATFFRSLRTSL